MTDPLERRAAAGAAGPGCGFWHTSPTPLDPPRGIGNNRGMSKAQNPLGSNDLRHRSYAARQRVRKDTEVTAIQDFRGGQAIRDAAGDTQYKQHVIHAGEQFIVRDFYNAGGQGILATIELADGASISGVSAGVIAF